MRQRSSLDRKEQIVSAAIERLYAVGFEGLRISDVAKAVGISNATLIHHYPSKVALVKAVVERFTQRFEAVADETDAKGMPHEKLTRHMRSSIELMRTSPEMFVVLNEIMLRARRDAEISHLVSVPLLAWQRHIIWLLLTSSDQNDTVAQSAAEGTALACMAQLLGMGLLSNLSDRTDAPFDLSRDPTKSLGICALADFVEQAS